jgi:uncharacterized OB-fold protein
MSTESSGLPTHEPTLTNETEPFWQGLAEGRVRLPRCTDCDVVVWYPRSTCPRCGATDLGWETMSGEGTIYSFSIARRTPGSWGKVTPYVLAYVELAEGPRVMTNVVGADPDTLQCGQRVTAVFDPTAEGMAVLRFRPLG